jgi:excisionase family DNA binding protein
MADDGSQLTIDEVAARLNVDAQTVSEWVASRLLWVNATVDGQRRIDGESVEALATALELPDGPERSRAMEVLRERNVTPPYNQFM